MDLADLVHPAEELGAEVPASTARRGGGMWPGAPWRGGSWRSLGREPLVHFIAIGALLAAADMVLRARADPHRIVVTAAHVDKLAGAYALQFGQRPDARTLEALVRTDIKDEMLFREGIAEGLDRGDEIVRRRVVQKMQFLLQDLNAPPEPTEADLKSFWKSHAARYVEPSRTSFSHIFFSSDAAGDAAALARARGTLGALNAPGAAKVVRAPERGDRFPDLYDFAAYEPDQVARVFGRTPFTDAVQRQPPGAWAGPYRSAYGWHLLYVSARAPGGLAPFDRVRERVRTDALQEAQDQANASAFARLARSFTVIRAEGRAAP